MLQIQSKDCSKYLGTIKDAPLKQSGLLSTGVPGVPWHSQILADQLTLSQPGGTDYAHHIYTGTSGLSDLPMALKNIKVNLLFKKSYLPLKLVGLGPFMLWSYSKKEI